MKKSYVLLVVLIILVLIAGCSKSQVESTRSGESSKTPAAQSGGSALLQDSGSPAIYGGSMEDKTETEKTAAKGAQVIVKSGSGVASKDKEALLNQIDQELDQVIRDINNLEDISDSDLE